MPTFTDTWTASEWLYETLNVSAVTTLATGGIYVGKAADGAVCPYVVMRSVPLSDLMVVGAVRIWSPQLWDVVAVNKNYWETADKIAAAVDVLLHRGSGTPSSGIVHECTREKAISFDEEDEGINYVYVGATYLVKSLAT